MHERRDEAQHLRVVQLPNLPEDHNALEGLKVLPSGDIHKLLVWDDSHVYVFNFDNLAQLTQCHPSVVEMSGLRAAFENDQQDVLMLNREGNLCLWSTVEDDPFQDVDPIPLKPQVLASNTLALAESSSSNIFYTLVLEAGKIKLVTSAVENKTLKEHSSQVVTDVSDGDLDGASRQVTFLSVQSNCISAKLLSLLCPRVDFEEDCDIVIISLNSNSVFFCPLVSAEEDRRIFEVCSSPQKVMHVTLAKDDSSSLLIFTANNTLISVEAENRQLKQTEHYCVCSQVVCQVSVDSFYVADAFGSSSFTFGQSPQSLTVKGSICASFIDENQALVLTLHGAVYLVDISVSPMEAPKLKNPTALLDQITLANAEIKKTQHAIKEENTRLAEVSMVSSARLLRNTFQMQIKVYDCPRLNSFSIVALVLNKSKYIFLEGKWNLVLSLSGINYHQSFSQCLSKTLRLNELVKVVAEFQIEELNFPLTARCHFLKQLTVPSSTDLNSIELPSSLVSVEVASLDLDFTYFITPLSVDPVQEYREGLQVPDETKAHKITWNTNSDIEIICKMLSKNCSHRAFGAIRNANKASFQLGSSRVDLILEENKLAVSSTSYPLLLDVVTHLHASTGVEDGNNAVTVDPTFALRAENVGLAHDYALLTDTYTEKVEADLQDQLRKLVVSQYPLPIND